MVEYRYRPENTSGIIKPKNGDFKGGDMTQYKGEEKRKYPRASGRFVVSYRVFDEANNVDISQTRNLSLGGMLLTTNRPFEPGTNLALEIRLPFDAHPILLMGKVVESREISKNMIYDTRIQFVAVDENHRRVIGGTVEYHLKNAK
ncbi:MAG: PilZ domain-containing protein [Candidatus Omnitrophota bacterium]|jgi:c-di-GMP-binding flagellar brake protein YcgR